jgi:hypothetical protein
MGNIIPEISRVREGAPIKNSFYTRDTLEKKKHYSNIL